MKNAKQRQYTTKVILGTYLVVLFVSASHFPAPSAQRLNSGLSCKLAAPTHACIYRYLDSLAITLQVSCRLGGKALGDKPLLPWRGRWHQHEPTAARSGGWS